MAQRSSSSSLSDGALGLLALVVLGAALLSRAHRHLGEVAAVGGAGLAVAVATGIAASWLKARAPRSPLRRRQEAGRNAPRWAERSREGWARPEELAPLLIHDPPGDRIVLGSMRRRLVAAEERQSVLVVGPSQSGKTTGLAVPAIIEWQGPVLATSVKSDLVRSTIEARRELGAVAIFDPTGSNGPLGQPGEIVGWSPLLAAGSWGGARRIAAAMCAVAESDGAMEDAGFWYASAEKLLAPLLFAAATSGSTMSDVVRWIDDEDVGDVLLALQLAGVPEALRAARTSFSREERQRASVFATAETVVAGFADPQVAAASMLTGLDPLKLLATKPDSPRPRGPGADTKDTTGGAKTLYCCAPAREQQRLRPVFTALVREIVDASFALAARQGRPLEPGLLMVLDEAANVAPIDELDSILATAAGHGIQLVTIWQDFAQIEARYGRRWSTIVNNHRAKVVCPGVSDPLTLDHVEALIGEHERPEVSTTVDADGRRSRTEVTALRRVAPAGSLRQLSFGTAALLYGPLAPARIQLRPPPGLGSDSKAPSTKRAGNGRVTSLAKAWRRLKVRPARRGRGVPLPRGEASLRRP